MQTRVARLHAARDLRVETADVAAPGPACTHDEPPRTRGPGRFVVQRQVSATGAQTLCGGGGNRTRVLRRLTRASPSAVHYDFLGPGDHVDKSPTGSVTV